jgi:hypothetical protein
LLFVSAVAASAVSTSASATASTTAFAVTAALALSFMPHHAPLRGCHEFLLGYLAVAVLVDSGEALGVFGFVGRYDTVAVRVELFENSHRAFHPALAALAFSIAPLPAFWPFAFRSLSIVITGCYRVREENQRGYHHYQECQVSHNLLLSLSGFQFYRRSGRLIPGIAQKSRRKCNAFVIFVPGCNSFQEVQVELCIVVLSQLFCTLHVRMELSRGNESPDPPFDADCAKILDYTETRVLISVVSHQLETEG